MDLQQRIEQLEEKVRHLEKEVAHLHKAKQQEMTTSLQPSSEELRATFPRKSAFESTIRKEPFNPPHVSEQQPSPQQKDWEQWIAKILLPRLFIVVFLIGVLWAFIAAVQAGIITESVRCVLGAVASGVMFWLGERQTRRNRQTLGHVLSGGAIAVLLISLFAAHMLYGIIGHLTAFILYILSIAFGVYIAIRRKSQSFMVIMMAAGYLVPFLVDSPNPNVWMFVMYEGLFSIVMMLLAAFLRYKFAFGVALSLLHIPLFVGYILGNWDEYQTPFMVAITLQHLVLLGTHLIPTAHFRFNHPLASFTAFALLAAWMYGLYGDTEQYAVIILAWSIVYTIAAVWLIRREKSGTTIHVTIATFAWFLLLIHLVRADVESIVFLVQGALALMLGIQLKSRWQQMTGGVMYLIGILLIITRTIPSLLSVPTLAWLLLLTSLIGLYLVAKRLPEDHRFKHLRLPLGWSFAIALLIFITQITNLSTEDLTLDFQHFILSAVWILFAIGIIIFGLTLQIRKARISGVIFLIFILLKIIFIDLPDISVTLRAILFLCLGGAGLGVSRLFYRKGNEE